MTSILLLVEPRDGVHHGLGRALMLARYLCARLDIVFFDTGHRHTLDASQQRESAALAHRFLEALRKSITAPDVTITTDMCIDGSIQECVARKICDAGPVLVVKSASRRPGTHINRDDLQLIQRCPVPLLLTRGRPWHPRGRVAAVIDDTDQQTLNIGSIVIQVSASLQTACDGDLDLVFARPERTSAPNSEELLSGQLSRQRLARECDITLDHIHLLRDNTIQALPRFIASMGYDLIATGVTENPASTVMPDSLVGNLLRSSRCDLLFVAHRSHGFRASPLELDSSLTSHPTD